jgi:hypothetical protein
MFFQQSWATEAMNNNAMKRELLHCFNFFVSNTLSNEKFSLFFKSISAGNRPFLRCFSTFQASWKDSLTSLTRSTTTPGPGTPTANSRRTKQF